MIKLLVVDLDGTLLKNHRSISKVNKEALKAVMERGIPIAVCTGRNHRLTIGIVKRLKLPVYYCCVGGTEIYNSDNELIKAENLDPEDIRKVLSIIKDESCLIQITKQDGYFKYATDSAAKKYEVFSSDLISGRIRNFVAKMFYVKNLEDYHKPVFNKSNEIVIGGDTEVLNRIREKVEASSEKLYCRMDLWPNYLFITNGYQSKDKAIEFLVNRIGITMDEVMALGDDYNDLDMIKAVGYGIAMDNALDVLKEVSYDQTLSNKEDGVAVAINHYIIEKRKGKIFKPQ